MPRGKLLSERVLELAYYHVDEPEEGDVVRVHEFKRGVELRVLSDGSLLIRRPDGRPLWAELER